MSAKSKVKYYSLRTALCESIRYQAKSEPNVRQDLIPRVRNGEAALMQVNQRQICCCSCTSLYMTSYE